MKKLILCLTLLMALQALAQDPKPTYNASKFGIRSGRRHPPLLGGALPHG